MAGAGVLLRRLPGLSKAPFSSRYAFMDLHAQTSATTQPTSDHPKKRSTRKIGPVSLWPREKAIAVGNKYRSETMASVQIRTRPIAEGAFSMPASSAAL